MKTTHYPRLGTMPVSAILGTGILSVVVVAIVLLEGEQLDGHTEGNGAVRSHARREPFSAAPRVERRGNTLLLPAGCDLRGLISSTPRRMRVEEDPFEIGYISETAALEDKQGRADAALASLLQRVNEFDPSGAVAEIVMIDMHRLHRNIIAAAVIGSEPRLVDAGDFSEPAYLGAANSSRNR